MMVYGVYKNIRYMTVFLFLASLRQAYDYWQDQPYILLYCCTIVALLLRYVALLLRYCCTMLLHCCAMLRYCWAIDALCCAIVVLCCGIVELLLRYFALLLSYPPKQCGALRPKKAPGGSHITRSFQGVMPTHPSPLMAGDSLRLIPSQNHARLIPGRQMPKHLQRSPRKHASLRLSITHFLTFRAHHISLWHVSFMNTAVSNALGPFQSAF